MATKTLARGMGTFFKDCEHPQSRWSKCPHEYKIRYRNGVGQRDLAESSVRHLDAHRLGLFDENPLKGVKPPQHCG
ncbi:hypothetical protein [Streptomyces sp. XD-27]|uniref:hypothetical protein n=1 Tax=Streptomyces sp. XD-27 TaxID=3062779 RepID=UPI0026F44D60|nr:hypothetical protein [Streptomyces sp. XD-27]WKX73585.1 hypothetical protein Q3Y56_30135 [Streptomyces sp. XD-27]